MENLWRYVSTQVKQALKEVTKVYVHEVDEILHLHTSCDNIDIIANQLFYVLGKGWVAAGDLNEEDEVYLIDGLTAFVTGAEIEKLVESIKVYNFEIADFNTYLVGDNTVLVHNYDKNTTYPDQDVYVLYDDKGNIQYVGRSKNGDVKLDQHSRSESRGHLNRFIVTSGIPYEAGRGMEQIGIDRFGTLNTSTDFNNQINGIGQNNGADIINIFMSAGQKYAHLFDEAFKMIRSIVANGG